jgi:hypothetical protein
MKTPVIENLKLPELLQSGARLSMQGNLTLGKTGLVYLDVDNAFIHDLYPFLKNYPARKPEYFGEGCAGAHISVVYPEEQTLIPDVEFGKVYEFRVRNVAAVSLNERTYYVLWIEAPALAALRKKYGLAELLSFRRYVIGLHLTIGVVK